MIKNLVLVCCLFTLASIAQAEVTLEQIQQELDITLGEETAEDFRSYLKDYNKDRGNKAVAFALIEDGGYSLGIANKAPSEVAAAMIATQKCEQWLQENERQGLCEVILLGEQVIKPGRVLRAGVGPDTPAMAWKVSGPKGDMYLLGTVHVLKSTLFPLPVVFDQFFTAADKIVFEVNPVLQSDPARQAAAAALMNADPAEQKDLYNKAQRKLIKQYTKSQGIHMNAVYTAKPVVNALQVTQLRTAAMGYSLASGVETHYARQASIHGKAIGELETMAEALASLFDLSPELQVRLLVDTIERLDEVATSIEVLVGKWMQGDAEMVYEQTVRDLAADPDFAHVAEGILDVRNEAWMVKLEQMLEEEGDVVVMVGTAHFGGPKGLLNLFRERGLEPVQHTWNGTPITP